MEPKIRFDDQDISILLAESGKKPQAIKQYLALENSIRSSYREIAALDLPDIEPANIRSILEQKKELPVEKISTSAPQFQTEPVRKSGDKLSSSKFKSKFKEALKEDLIEYTKTSYEYHTPQLPSFKSEPRYVYSQDDESKNLESSEVKRWRVSQEKPKPADLIITAPPPHSNKRRKKYKRIASKPAIDKTGLEFSKKRLPLEYFDDHARFGNCLTS
jgi:hypothetical protein